MCVPVPYFGRSFRALRTHNQQCADEVSERTWTTRRRRRGDQTLVSECRESGERKNETGSGGELKTRDLQ